MLKLRKILLCDYIYYIFIILVIIYSLITLSIPKKSHYKNPKEITGIITKIIQVEDKLTLYVKNKETFIATIYLKEKLSQINLGEKVTITGKFKTPQENTTDYLFNYQKYLNRKGIFYQIEATSIKKVNQKVNIYYALKQKLINHLDNNPYLYTFILGDKSYLNQDVKRSYQSNGISHLFAISGMHITLLSSLLSKILKKIKFQEEQRFKIISVILLIYLLLTGLSPSILRGILFYYLFSINNIYYFYIKPINLYLVILGITLLINPNYIYDIGFQYSYLISFSLLVSMKSLESSNYLLTLLKVSILSFLVSIPITIYNFYQLNILGIIYNLFFVPLVSIIIFPLSLLVLIIKPLMLIFNLFITIMEQISLLLNNISFLKIIFRRMPLIFYLIYLLLIIIYLITRNKKVLIIYFLLLFIHYLIPYFDTSTYLKVIDVGQGDSILLKSKNKAVLVDTGGNETYRSNQDGAIYHNTLSPLLKSLGIKKLTYLILTHGDKDHLGEAETLLNNMPVKKVIINDNRINYYEKKIINKNTIIGSQGLSFKVNDLYFIQLNENLQNENDSSQIYLVKYKNIKILLTGDASIKSEENLLSNYDLGKILILKVGHHGSRTSTSEKLLTNLKPKIALISSGKDNKFNHPHKEIISRLKENNVRIYNTKEQGTITINLKKLIISTGLT